MKTASGRFRGIPVAPHVAAQSPADFHPAVQWSVERDPVKSRITQQLPVRATFEGVESEPFRFEFPADAVEEGGGFREGERSGKYSITRESAFIRANAGKSSSCQQRRIRRSVGEGSSMVW